MEEELQAYITRWEEYFECIEVDIPLVQESLENAGISTESFYSERNKYLPQNVSAEEYNHEEISRKSAEETLNKLGVSARKGKMWLMLRFTLKFYFLLKRSRLCFH